MFISEMSRNIIVGLIAAMCVCVACLGFYGMYTHKQNLALQKANSALTVELNSANDRIKRTQASLSYAITKRAALDRESTKTTHKIAELEDTNERIKAWGSTAIPDGIPEFLWDSPNTLNPSPSISPDTGLYGDSGSDESK